MSKYRRQFEKFSVEFNKEWTVHHEFINYIQKILAQCFTNDAEWNS